MHPPQTSLWKSIWLDEGDREAYTYPFTPVSPVLEIVPRRDDN